MKLKINNKIYQNFTSYTVNLKFNAIASSFQFNGLKDMLNAQLTYNKVEIFNDDNDLLITGVLINHNYSISAMPHTVSLSGYSLSGILEDCNLPPELYPLQTDNLSLEQLCQKILPKFNLKYKYSKNISGDFLQAYKKKNVQIGQGLSSFFSSSASQKGIILSHTAAGELNFLKYDNSKQSVYDFYEGNSDIISLILNTNGQNLHSEITILKQASATDKSTGQSTIKNPMIKSYRPKVKISNSGSVFDTEKAAKIELANELRQLKFIIQSKKFINSGEIIKLKAPSLNINNFVELFVEQTDIQGNQNGEIYTLNCVMKEVYTLEIPKNIFL